jgi:dihydrofolate synthase/folylpolyglutamate synthase
MVYMPHWPSPGVKHHIELGLERMHSLLEKLGNPHLALPPVIHVAGTNGKGSSTAYLKAILEHAGLSVHRYTSPHIMRFNQRIELAGSEITDRYLYEVLEETRIASQGIHATFFEATTAAAFLAFARVKADVLVLEVGMGGRLDATNVVPNTVLSIITPVGLDHMEFLGNSIKQIAAEKAGIIKPSSPCVISWQHQEAMDVIKSKALELGAPPYAWGEHWDFMVEEDAFKLIDLATAKDIMALPKPGLLGLHQVVNAAAVAVGVKRFLPELWPNVSDDSIAYGVKHAVWPGRLQKIDSGILVSSLPQGYELWMDGAHNADGAQMLAASIAHMWQDKPTVIINGRTGKRDIESFLRPFSGNIEQVYAVTVQSEPNGEKSSNIAHIASQMGFVTYDCYTIADAIMQVVTHNPPCRILATGSLYLLADIVNCDSK